MTNSQLLQRAFALARNGTATSAGDVRHQLCMEGYSFAQVSELNKPELRKLLEQMIRGATKG
jgi:hypothetical protein